MSTTLHPPEDLALSLPARDVVLRLVDLLGLRTVAVIAGVSQTRTVRQWTEGTQPSTGVEDALRLALQAALIVRERVAPETVRAWFAGANRRLDDQAPALVIRERPDSAMRGRLLSAARAFLSAA
ncbi:MAG: hypothetical protein GIX03_10420 [Candidatus Eremiobacteraeota bacterium]|nr:hypothetical protein [Candidatus Eremiobacteraeota bacterium]MBC5820679.1 hypothetical protein [Candidatus Eremiobacteraeota bacterium]